VAVLLLGLGIWGIARSISGHSLDRPFVVVALIVEVELLVQAAIATVVVIGGHTTESLPEFAGYAISSVILIPVTLERARGAEPSRWDPAIVGAVCLALAVAVGRMLSLWETG
jgi:hypothetical protein